ncbi:MAG TPA: glycosyltransferase [Acidimicrobiales bacterium]|nr:glycosyltransferase [Acidimicrobiales bacterium]
MSALHQFVPTLEPGAVGAHMLEIRSVARAIGVASELFAEHVHPALATEGRPFADYGTRLAAQPGDVLVYQTAIGSVVADFVAARSETLVVNHHNITPEHFFAPWEPGVVHGLRWGRVQLATLADRARLGIADSAYNEAELVALGYRETEVVPVLVDVAAHDAEVDHAYLERLRERSSGPVWLFVGRVAPNKAQHDLVKALAAYRRAYDPGAVLRIVGSSSSDAYLRALTGFAAALGLGDAVELEGGVSPGQLVAHYQAADVLVCLSEHEGFCVPLLEAMHHRVPIVAYAAAVVPETLGAGGLCLAAKDPATVAAAVHRVVDDPELAGRLVAAGTARLADFELAATRQRMAAVLERLLGP